MTASMRQQPAPTRQEFAERLLKGSVKKSYAPVVDIDWDAPLDPDKFFLPPKCVSLYGTPMWDEMTREQQIELSRQELVNTLSAGIWFENILNQALLRKIMHQDPTARSTHYELTELGDETRHMVMFGKAIEHVGAKPVQPRWWHRDHHQRVAVGLQGIRALGGRADRRGDLRLTAAADDGRPRTAADGAAAHADSRDRGSPAHPVRPRRAAEADADHGPPHQVVGVQHQRPRRVLLPLPVHQQGPVPPRRTRRATGRAGSPAPASTVTRFRSRGFAPLAAFLDEVGLMGPIARRMWRRTGFLPR